jgi:hypothetical protein
MEARRGPVAIAFVVVGLVACKMPGAWGGGCDPEYDDPKGRTVSWCEGDVVASYREACGDRIPNGREDCAAAKEKCVVDGPDRARCVTPCTSDDGCSLFEYCPVGGGYCVERRAEGDDCAGRGCAPGLVCAPEDGGVATLRCQRQTG